VCVCPQLDVGEEELQRRVKALAAAEAAAAAVVAAEATAAKAPAGTTSGKRPAGGRSSIAGAAPPAVAPAGEWAHCISGPCLFVSLTLASTAFEPVLPAV
jgi:hypothetical protein